MDGSMKIQSLEFLCIQVMGPSFDLNKVDTEIINS